MCVFFPKMKIASSVEGVFLVGPSGGKLRPWCGHCHKFLKSETAPHDCTPIDFAKVRGASKKSSEGRKRIRLTPKNKAILNKVFKAAALGEDLSKKMSKIHSLCQAKKPNIKAIKKAVTKAESKSVEKRANHLVKKFL